MVEYQTFIVSPDFNISLVLKRILNGPWHVFNENLFLFCKTVYLCILNEWPNIEC